MIGRTKCCLLLLSLLLTRADGVGAQSLVVEALDLRTAAGPPIARARVLVEDGRIRAVAPASEIAVPNGARTLSAAVVTPGFIDAHTSAGLSGLTNVEAVRDQDERTDPDQSALRVLDAFDPNDPLLRFLLEHGVTVVQTTPGPANPIAGQAAIFRTHGRSADEMLIRSPSAMVFNLGEQPKTTYRERRGGSTRMGTAALIRQRLRAADASSRWFGSEPPQLGRDALREVVHGRLPTVFTAHRADDILTALRIAREFELDDVAIAAGTEGYRVREELRAAGVPVWVGPVMERVSAPETENASYENAALLAQADIPIAIRSGFESYVPKNRVLLFEAAIAAVNGLGDTRALAAITRDPARQLGLDDRGTLEVGKVADLVLFDGDPFEYTSHVTAVIAGGEVVYER